MKNRPSAVIFILALTVYSAASASPPVEPYSAGANAEAGVKDDAARLLALAHELKEKKEYGKAARVLLEAARLSQPGPAFEIRLEAAALFGRGGSYNESIAVYNELLKEDRLNTDARTGLARVYGWSGDYASAVGEYRAVLERDPGNMEALIGLSSVYSWMGELDRAIAGFNAALEKDESNSEARLALARVLWWKGERKRSLEELTRIISSDPGNREAQTLKRLVREDMGPLVSLKAGFSRDSDSNRLDLFRVRGYMNLGRFIKPALEYSQFEAVRKENRGRARVLTLSDSISAARRLEIKPVLSLVIAESGPERTAYMAGGVNAVIDAGSGLRAAASYKRSPYLDTAQLIRNNIRVTDYSASLLYGGNSAALSASASASYGDYSDGNGKRSYAANISTGFAGGCACKAAAGYALEYAEFSKTTFSGYFNPRSIFSNELYLSVSGDIYNGRISYNSRAAAGIQRFSSRSEQTASLFIGATGRISEDLSLEAGYTWSRSALESSAGNWFKEYRLGVNYLF